MTGGKHSAPAVDAREAFIEAAEEWARSVDRSLSVPHGDRDSQERAAVAIDRAEQAALVAWRVWKGIES